MMCLAIFPLRSSAPKTSISDSLGVSAPKALNLSALHERGVGF